MRLPRLPQEAWEQAPEAAEIEGFRFHDLRNSAASYLAMSGATVAEIAEVLDLTEAIVKSRLFEGMRMLREYASLLKAD